MSLEVIRSKLDPMYSDHYKDVNSFINDARLIFRNVYLFYRVSNGKVTTSNHKIKKQNSHFRIPHSRRIQRSTPAYDIWTNFSNSNWLNGCPNTAVRVIIQQISSMSKTSILERAPKEFVPMTMCQ